LDAERFTSSVPLSYTSQSVSYKHADINLQMYVLPSSSTVLYILTKPNFVYTPCRWLHVGRNMLQ